MNPAEVETWASQAGVPPAEALNYLQRLEAVEKQEEVILDEIFSGLNGPVLELSAGRGEFTRQLLKKYLRSDGKLYTTERLPEVAEKLAGEINDPRLEVLVGDSSSLPLSDGSVGLVVSRAALHDFVSDDGDVARALRDCVRVLRPGGTFAVYDKIRDGFREVEAESAEGRMEQLNIELAALEGKVCWGLHYLGDYVRLMEELGLSDIRTELLEMPDRPGYVKHMSDSLEERRPAYVRRWGPKVNDLLDGLYADFQRTPSRALPLAFIWGRKN